MWDRLPYERLHARIFFFFLPHFFTLYFDGSKAFWSPQGSPRMFCLTTGGYILFTLHFLGFLSSEFLHRQRLSASPCLSYSLFFLAFFLICLYTSMCILAVF